MSARTPTAEANHGRGSLWAYNVRILLANSYWLIVTPVAAAQLVLFWNMAVVSSTGVVSAVQTIELLAPILGAFLCAHVLLPEQGKVGELVFVRPVSLERVLVLRIAAAFAFVLIVVSPVLYFYHAKVDGFPLGAALLAALPPLLFLSVLALAAASVLRHPLFGFAVAGAFWTLDLATGGYYNALVSLHSFADSLADKPMSDLWLTNKLVLTALAAVVYLWLRSRLGQPVAPRRWRATALRSLAVAAIALAYFGLGAGHKLAYGIRHEAELGARSHLWYQLQFRGYGPLPLARLFGPAFPLYVQTDLGPGGLGLADAQGPILAPVDLSRLHQLLQRYPRSIWADNAQLEIALHALRRRADDVRLLIARAPGRGQPSQRLLEDDLRGGRDEFERLVADYPRSPFGPLALSQLAAIGLSELDFPLAIRSYERLIEHYPHSPDAYTAGLKLNRYYLATGQPGEALAAADIAAAAGLWDVRADALLAAGRAAQAAGRKDVARDRYEQARDAARRAADRSIAGARSPSGLNKGEMFAAANAVIAACDQALGGDLAPPPLPASRRATTITGQVLLARHPAARARVAIGPADPNGFPSPFSGFPPGGRGGSVAVAGDADSSGRFALESVPEGNYPALAVLVHLPGEQIGGERRLLAPSLPIVVDRPRPNLGVIRVVPVVPAARIGPRLEAGTRERRAAPRDGAVPRERSHSPIPRSRDGRR
ncbi:MAG: tol-pal system YbgF family protein [Armatimonadota bacterium]